MYLSKFVVSLSLGVIVNQLLAVESRFLNYQGTGRPFLAQIIITTLIIASFETFDGDDSGQCLKLLVGQGLHGLFSASKHSFPVV